MIWDRFDENATYREQYILVFTMHLATNCVHVATVDVRV
jgi:hypothetical protein